MVLGRGDTVEEIADPQPRLEYVLCCGVYCPTLVSAETIVTIEERRTCGKLTPRLKLLCRTATGGLLVQWELPKEDRDIAPGRTERVRCDGSVRFEEVRETAELRLEFCLRVCTLRELRV